MTAGPFMATVVDTSGLALYLVGDCNLLLPTRYLRFVHNRIEGIIQQVVVVVVVAVVVAAADFPPLLIEDKP